jgi:phosphatidylglycerol:prolipoprotein diacylglycerol transferase
MYHLHQIDPIALSLGPVQVHWYGIMYLLGFGAGWWLGAKRIRAGRMPVDSRGYSDLVFNAMLGVILGGRLGYMLIYGWEQWIADPVALLRVWEGGMSFHGGLIGVLIAVWLWARANKLVFWDVVDFMAPLVPPGLAFGRIGNYIGGELWGRTTDLPWAVIFPSGLPGDLATGSAERLAALHASGALDAFARHPSQLYEAFLEGVVMFALLWWYSSRSRPRYAVSGLFALLYGVFRFAIEFVRVPDAHIGYLAFDWFTMGMLLCVPLIAAGIGLLVLAGRQGRPRATQAPGS